MRALAEYLGAMENVGKVVWWTRVNSGMIPWAYKGKQGMMHLARTGTPDFIGCLPGGKFFAIEAKGSSGKPSPAQTETLNKLNKSGAIALLVYNINDVESLFLDGKQRD